MSTDFAALHRALVASLGDVTPVAVSYVDAPPAGVAKFSGTVPSGCSFWSAAAAGDGFYTVPGDHLSCPIGSYTHAIDLPAERAPELEGTLSLMASIGYVRMEEVPSIPRLPATPACIVYTPLAKAAAPDVVIVAGRPGPLMRLQEAAASAGAAASLPMLGRPTCMALPAAMAHGAVLSSACIGNRVYTGLGDDQLYLMIPGNRLAEVVEKLAVIDTANQTLAQYHAERKRTLTATA
jgi:uncharacterized protein (DUF169 family)